MVQMDGDHGQKGMVGMAKDIGVLILELYKRECLMSLLECGDHKHGQMEQGMKVQGHNTAIVLVTQFSGLPLLESSSFSMGPGSSSSHDPIDSYISIGLGCRCVIISFHAVKKLKNT